MNPMIRLAGAVVFVALGPCGARAQGFGTVNEVYRQQLGASAAAAAASAGVYGAGGLGAQSTNQLDNAVQINNNYYVSGSGTILNVTGDQVNAQQQSTGTTQTSANQSSRGSASVGAATVGAGAVGSTTTNNGTRRQPTSHLYLNP